MLVDFIRYRFVSLCEATQCVSSDLDDLYTLSCLLQELYVFYWMSNASLTGARSGFSEARETVHQHKEEIRGSKGRV